MTDTNKVVPAMNDVAELNKAGISVQGGKKYTQVVTRVEVFRKHFGYDYSINTDVKPLGSGFLIKATVSNGDLIIGTGHAYAASIQKEKSIEKLETTAIGRALACCGLSGGEYSSVEENESWTERYEPKTDPSEEWANKMIGQIRSYQDTETLDKAMAWIEGQPAWGSLSQIQQDAIVNNYNNVRDAIKAKL